MAFWEGKVLAKFQGISVLLWLCFGIFAGKCCGEYVGRFLKKRGCEGTPRLIKSPVPELINGLLWVFTAMICADNTELFFYGIFLSVLFCIAVADGCVFEIPILLNGVIAGLGMIKIFTDFGHWPSYVTGSLLAGGIFLLVYLVTGKKGIGGGDIKLMAAAGLLLGAPKILYALFFGCVLAVLVQLPLKWFCKKNNTFALGPYLVAGIGGMVWFGDKILQLEQLLG